jgi:hypothetical protein
MRIAMGAILITNGRPGINRASVLVLLYDAGTSTGRRASEQPGTNKPSLLAYLGLIAAKLCGPALPDRNHRATDEGIRELKLVYRAYFGRLSESTIAKIETHHN